MNGRTVLRWELTLCALALLEIITGLFWVTILSFQDIAKAVGRKLRREGDANAND